MSRVPIRVRLTAAFALAMAVVLAAAGLFVYLRLEEDLDESVRATLESRAAAPREADEGFVQRVGEDGTVAYTEGGATGPVLTPTELRQAAREEIEFDREVPGIEGTARVLAGPAGAEGGGVVVVGQSLEDRDETLAGVVASFAIGGPVAVLLASLLGYVLAAAGLAPVEAMRRRAAEVSFEDADARLPLPAAHDEIRRLGETLNAMLDRLRESHDRERRFVADASHELRTPVAVVKAELEAAQRGGPHDPQVEEALTVAVEECDRLAQLAEDLLVLARTGDGGLPVRTEPLVVDELLEGVRARFADRARARGRTIRVEPANGLRLDADDLRLRQALGNLVDNSLRHGEGEIVLRASAAPGVARLEVSDAGQGFPPELRGRAFERFARGDAARARGGAGLGLAIVRAIAQAHGGSAEIVGADGATVRISLPAKPSQGPLSEPS